MSVQNGAKSFFFIKHISAFEITTITVCTTCSNIKKLFILLRVTYEFPMFLRVKRNYFLTQH